MSTTTILVWTSAESAVLHCCQHGWHRLEIDLSTWTPEEREVLASRIVSDEGARYGRRGNPHDVAPPTEAALRVQVQEHLREEAAQHAENQAKHDAQVALVRSTIEEYRTRPVCDLLWGRSLDMERLWNLPSMTSRDAIQEVTGSRHPTIAEACGRMEEVAAYIAAQHAEVDRLGADLPVEALIDEDRPRYTVDITTALARSLKYTLTSEQRDRATAEIGRRQNEEHNRVSELLAKIAPELLPRWNDDMLPSAELDGALTRLLEPLVEGLEERAPGEQWGDGYSDGMTAAEHEAYVLVVERAKASDHAVTVDLYDIAVRTGDWDTKAERVAVQVSMNILGRNIRVKRLLPR